MAEALLRATEIALGKISSIVLRTASSITSSNDSLSFPLFLPFGESFGDFCLVFVIDLTGDG